MKKIIAITLSVLLIISLLPMAAFAGGTKEEVQAKIVATRDALYANKESFAANESLDFLLYISAGGDADKYTEGYLAAIRDAFDAGNMTTADRIGLLIFVCAQLGEDIENFKLNDGSTVNLYDLMKEKGTEVDSPYNYYYVLLSSRDKEYSEEITAALAEKYTPGSGYDYYGFGTDSTANFAAIMQYNDNYIDLVEDAVNVVESAKTDKGYYYLADYGTDANANSTASALFAFADMEDMDKADVAYDLLKNFELGDGNYFYMDNDKSANAYANRDALRALLAYDARLDEPDSEPTEPAQEQITDTTDTTDTTDVQDVQDVPAVDNVYETNDDAQEKTANAQSVTTQPAEQKQSTPATGDSFIACGVAGIAVLALGIAVATRKKEK